MLLLLLMLSPSSKLPFVAQAAAAARYAARSWSEPGQWLWAWQYRPYLLLLPATSQCKCHMEHDACEA